MAYLGDRLRQLKRDGKKVFVVYLCAGDPAGPGASPGTELFLKVVKALKPYVDVFEIGVPFTDPVADGPVIQSAMTRALNRGTTVNRVYNLCKRVIDVSGKPVVLMTAYNIVHKRGVSRFVEDSLRAGIKGMIIPDLPAEEAGEFCYYARDRLDTIFLATPAGDHNRCRMAAERSTGFIYYVSLKGITGARAAMPERTLRRQLASMRKLTDKPVYVGFGISNPGQVSGLRRACDGIIIGSRLLTIIEDTVDSGTPKLVREIERFAGSIRQALDQ